MDEQQRRVETGRVFRKRVGSGFLLSALLVLAAYLLPVAGVWALLVALSSVALLEFYHMVKRANIACFPVLGTLLGAAIITVTLLGLRVESVPPGRERTAEWDTLVLFAAVLACVLREFSEKQNERAITSVACTLVGVLYVPFLFNFFTRLAFTWGEAPGVVGVGTTGRRVVFYLVIVVKSTDAGAFFTGMTMGRHKLLPRISPGKTWEGLIGGLLAGSLASCLFVLASGGVLGEIALGWGDALWLGVILAGVGSVGDLAESLFKRAVGAKDSGSIIPGMGGLLDILDSLLPAAPALYYYLRLFA